MAARSAFPRLVYDPTRRSLYVFLRDRRPEDVARSELLSLRLGFTGDRRLAALTLEETALVRLGRMETAREVAGASIGPHREFLDLALSERSVAEDRKGWDAIADFDAHDDLIGLQVFFAPSFGDPRFLLKGLEVETVRFV